MLKNNLPIFDPVIEKEARGIRSETIHEINKNRKRRVIMGESKISRRPEEAKKREEEITKVVTFLFNRDPMRATSKEIYNHIFSDAVVEKQKVKYIQNLLQTIRCASEEIIFTKEGIWRITPGYHYEGKRDDKALEILLKKIIANKNARYQKPKVEKPKLSETPRPPKRAYIRKSLNDVHKENHLKATRKQIGRVDLESKSETETISITIIDTSISISKGLANIEIKGEGSISIIITKTNMRILKGDTEVINIM
jgi:hypothetical protein